VPKAQFGAIDVAAGGYNLQERLRAFLIIGMNVLDRASPDALLDAITEDLLDGGADVFVSSIGADNQNEVGDVLRQDSEVILMWRD
jgi:hypothetical protein